MEDERWDQAGRYRCRKHGRLEGPYCEACEPEPCANCRRRRRAEGSEFCGEECEKEYQGE